MASKYDAAQPDKPNPCTHQPEMSTATTGHGKEEDYDKKKNKKKTQLPSMPACSMTGGRNQGSRFRYVLGNARKEEETPMYLSQAVNEQRIPKAA